MEAGRAQEVLNPYEWLPPYGESSVSVLTVELDLIVTVEYDGAGGSLESKQLRFGDASCFYKASWPGPYLLSLTRASSADGVRLGSLIEYPDSEAAKAWTKHFGSKVLKHYLIHFLAENMMIEVFATNVVIVEQQ